MSERRRVLSVTLADCRVDTFRSGGKWVPNEAEIDPREIKVEVRENGQWVER